MLSPLKIIFRLGTPMVPSAYPIHLDALVAYALTRSRLGEIDDGADADENVRVLASRLPFAKHEQDGEWVWKASALIPVGVKERSVRMWTRKTNAYDFAVRAANNGLMIGARTKNMLDAGVKFAGGIDTARGLLKNQFDFYPVEAVSEMHAWCIGDINEIEALLAPESGLLTHLGKRSRVGHGQIESVDIEVCEEATQKWRDRVLPWRENEHCVPIQAAFRPPYWAAENRGNAFVPVTL